MHYAILAYHVEDVVTSWTSDEDAAVMSSLHGVHDKMRADGRMGPAARLGATGDAFTLRGPGAGVVIDGPFAETKEQLLGFYVVDCATRDDVIAIARDLRRVNPTAAYEIRPVILFLPGASFAATHTLEDNATALSSSRGARPPGRASKDAATAQVAILRGRRFATAPQDDGGVGLRNDYSFVSPNVARNGWPG